LAGAAGAPGLMGGGVAMAGSMVGFGKAGAFGKFGKSGFPRGAGALGAPKAGAAGTGLEASFSAETGDPTTTIGRAGTGGKPPTGGLMIAPAGTGVADTAEVGTGAGGVGVGILGKTFSATGAAAAGLGGTTGAARVRAGGTTTAAGAGGTGPDTGPTIGAGGAGRGGRGVAETIGGTCAGREAGTCAG
jgi:hypothetical protein